MKSEELDNLVHDWHRLRDAVAEVIQLDPDTLAVVAAILVVANAVDEIDKTLMVK